MGNETTQLLTKLLEVSQRMESRLETIDKRLDAMETRLGKIEMRLDTLEIHVTSIDMQLENCIQLIAELQEKAH